MTQQASEQDHSTINKRTTLMMRSSHVLPVPPPEHKHTPKTKNFVMFSTGTRHTTTRGQKNDKHEQQEYPIPLKPSGARQRTTPSHRHAARFSLDCIY